MITEKELALIARGLIIVLATNDHHEAWNKWRSIGSEVAADNRFIWALDTDGLPFVIWKQFCDVNATPLLPAVAKKQLLIAPKRGVPKPDSALSTEAEITERILSIDGQIDRISAVEKPRNVRAHERKVALLCRRREKLWEKRAEISSQRRQTEAKEEETE